MHGPSQYLLSKHYYFSSGSRGGGWVVAVTLELYCFGAYLVEFGAYLVALWLRVARSCMLCALGLKASCAHAYAHAAGVSSAGPHKYAPVLQLVDLVPLGLYGRPHPLSLLLVSAELCLSSSEGLSCSCHLGLMLLQLLFVLPLPVTACLTLRLPATHTIGV
jgi:hypothetical protein